MPRAEPSRSQDSSSYRDPSAEERTAATLAAITRPVDSLTISQVGRDLDAGLTAVSGQIPQRSGNWSPSVIFPSAPRYRSQSSDSDSPLPPDLEGEHEAGVLPAQYPALSLPPHYSRFPSLAPQGHSLRNLSGAILVLLLVTALGVGLKTQYGGGGSSAKKKRSKRRRVKRT